MENHSYNYDEQQPFAAAEFAENPEPRCPCVLLLDTSGSMQGESIEELNRGLQAFRDEIFNDSLSLKRVEIAIVTFGPVRVMQDFTTADEFRPPKLEASGDTPLAGAVLRGLELLKFRKQVLRENGIKLFRPWIFLITDGAPTDNWQKLPQIIREGEENKSFSFFALGVRNADFNVLKQIAVREPLRLSGVRFREFFLWLSASLKSVSRSNPGETVSIPDYRPYGWSEV
jgi:Uncharacterized protein encoded in toxicity protection region of plasmid R478, contains von Willebrand factor (vWF) domain